MNYQEDTTIDEVKNLVEIPEDQIASKECRFATYCKPSDFNQPDLHVIKEIIHTKDGRTIPNQIGRAHV